MKLFILCFILTACEQAYSAPSSAALTIFTTDINVFPEVPTNKTLAVIPEPSTYALLLLSAAAIAGYNLRRRRRNKP
jgi:hypothetical protein